MRLTAVKSWSQGRKAAVIASAAVFLVVVLWLYLLVPLNGERRRLEAGIDRMTRDLQSKNYLLKENVLVGQKQAEEDTRKALLSEWKATVSALSAFPGYRQPGNVGHIDFKVALFDARQTIQRKAGELGINLPRDLGMDDKVESDEDARKLLFQLRAVERLVDMVFAQRFDRLAEIRPLPTAFHTIGTNTLAYAEEYPVFLHVQGGVDSLDSFLRSLYEPGQVFLLRQLRVEPVSADRPDALDITAMLGALVFTRSPDQIGPGTGRGEVRALPRGY